MVTNENGKVAIRYYQSENKFVKIGESAEHQYLFETRAAGISLAWVNASDVDAVLKIMKGCGCSGGSQHPMFHLASEMDVKIWTTGDK